MTERLYWLAWLCGVLPWVARFRVKRSGAVPRNKQPVDKPENLAIWPQIG